jgi:type IV pilus assembly protein PilE
MHAMVTARHRHPVPARPWRHGGFTLVELMIALVVIGILLAVAYPAFTDSIRKGRRSEAFAALAALQQAQERWRSNNPSYAGAPATLALAATTTPGGYYTLTIASNTDIGYVATAAAVSGTSQASDGACAKLSVKVERGSVSYASCASCSTFTYTAGDQCWRR